MADATASTLPPQKDVLRWARDLYSKVVDKKDAAGFAAVFTSEASLRFANAEPIAGRAAIGEAIALFFSSFNTLRHEGKAAWLVKKTLIVEAVVTYRRHDGKTVTIPAVTIFSLAGISADRPDCPVADGCRIYVDLTPLYAG